MSTTTTAEQSPGSTSAVRVAVEVWTDLGCPWCYLGEHRLDRALEQVGADRFELVLRPFQLDPGASTEPMTIPEVFVAKHGGTPAQAVAQEAAVAGLARAEGLPFTTERLHANTADVLRVLAAATGHGRGRDFARVLKRAFFAGEVDPYDPDTLVSVAATVGVPADAVRTVLAGDAFADVVAADRARALTLGITSVPFVVLDGRLGVAGAQSVEDHVRALRTALREQP